MSRKYSSNEYEEIQSFIKERIFQLDERLSQSRNFKHFKDKRIDEYFFKISYDFFNNRHNRFDVDVRDELIYAIRVGLESPGVNVEVKHVDNVLYNGFAFLIKRKEDWFEEIDIEEKDGCRD